MPVTLYRSGSPGESRPLVLLHPLGVDHTFWDALIDAHPQRDIVTIDLPGHGVSPVTAGASLEAMARSVATALRAAGLTEVDVVGVSLGGLICQHLASRDDITVAKLVLVDTVISYPSAVREQWRSRAATARAEGMAPLLEPTLQTWFTSSYLADPADRLRQLIGVFSAADPEGYATSCEALAEANTVGLLDALDLPTLVVCGEDDLPHFRADAERLAGAITGADLTWLPGRHGAAFEYADEFGVVLQKFLSDGGTA